MTADKDALLNVAYEAARDELSEYRQQDDYLLAHGASLLSDESHEIFHVDALRRAVTAAVTAALEQPADGVVVPQQGTWKLIAPDGRTWEADSPLKVLVAEINERIPPHVQLARIKAELEQNDDGWVKCSERLPEHKVTVLCAAKRVCKGMYSYDGDRSTGHWIVEDEHPDNANVTHWRPLPPLPKE